MGNSRCTQGRIIRAAIAALLTMACNGPHEATTGTLQMELTAEGNSGNRYRLRTAQFSVTGASSRTVSSEDDPSHDQIQVALRAGAYVIHLADGWRLERLTATGAEEVADSALLISPNPVVFAIADRTATTVTFQFQVGGEVIAFGDGVLVVGIGVSEIDGGVPSGDASGLGGGGAGSGGAAGGAAGGGGFAGARADAGSQSDGAVGDQPGRGRDAGGDAGVAPDAADVAQPAPPKGDGGIDAGGGDSLGTIDGEACRSTGSICQANAECCTGVCTPDLVGNRTCQVSVPAPTGLSAQALSARRILVTWTDPALADADPQNGIAIIRRQASPVGPWFVAGSVGLEQQTFIDDVDLLASTSYQYRVYSYTPKAASSATAVASVQTPDVTAPPVGPSQVSATAVSGWEVVVSWNDDDITEDGFVIERSRDDGSEPASDTGPTFRELARVAPNTTSYRDRLAVANSTYSYRVTAFNAVGGTGASAVVTTPDATPTLISGNLKTDLTLSAGEYEVTGPVAAFPGVRIIIGSGATVRFRFGASLDSSTAFSATGTADNPIIFSSTDPSGAPNAWNGFLIRDSTSVHHAVIMDASAALNYPFFLPVGQVSDVRIEGCATALSGQYPGIQDPHVRLFLTRNAGLFYFNFSPLSVAYSRIEQNANLWSYSPQSRSVTFSQVLRNAFPLSGGLGVYVSGAEIGITGSVNRSVVTNNMIGVDLFGGAIHSSIFGNATATMKVGTGAFFVDITDSWLGTTDIDVINQSIVDFSDDPSLGIVRINSLAQQPVDAIPDLP